MRLVLAVLLASAALAAGGWARCGALRAPGWGTGGTAGASPTRGAARCPSAVVVGAPCPRDATHPILPSMRAADVVSTDTYKCDPSKCKPPTCMCASNSPPGGLTADQMPQFILVGGCRSELNRCMQLNRCKQINSCKQLGSNTPGRRELAAASGRPACCAPRLTHPAACPVTTPQTPLPPPPPSTHTPPPHTHTHTLPPLAAVARQRPGRPAVRADAGRAGQQDPGEWVQRARHLVCHVLPLWYVPARPPQLHAVCSLFASVARLLCRARVPLTPPLAAPPQTATPPPRPLPAAMRLPCRPTASTPPTPSPPPTPPPSEEQGGCAASRCWGARAGLACKTMRRGLFGARSTCSARACRTVWRPLTHCPL